MMRCLPIVVAAACVLTAAAPAPAGRIVPLGNIFQVNTTTTGDQTNPAIATLADRSFIIVWQSPVEHGYCRFAYRLQGITISCAADEDCPPNDSYPSGEDACDPITGIFGQRFDSAGARLGTELRFDEPAIALRTSPDVTSLPDGGFVLAWDDSLAGIGARIYDAAGVARGPRLEVGAPENLPTQPRLASDASGRFIVVWSEYFGDRELRAKRYHSTGEVAQDDFAISEPISPYRQQVDPAVAMNPAGEFIVAWQNDWSFTTVQARRFRSNGMPAERAFVVEGRISRGSYSPDVVLYPNGSFVVAWEAYYDFDPVYDVQRIRARWYDAEGRPSGSRFIAASAAGVSDRMGGIATAPDHNFVIAWTSGPDIGVRAHAISGRASIPTSLTGTSFPGYTVRTPAIAALDSNEFIVSWAHRIRGSCPADCADPPVCCEQSGFALRAQRIRVELEPFCLGDCNNDGDVTVYELVTAVNIAFGRRSLLDCEAIDRNGDRITTVDELVTSVHVALSGCAEDR